MDVEAGAHVVCRHGRTVLLDQAEGVLEAAGGDMQGGLAVHPAGELVIDEEEVLFVLVVRIDQAVRSGPGLEKPRAIDGVVTP